MSNEVLIVTRFTHNSQDSRAKPQQSSVTATTSLSQEGTAHTTPMKTQSHMEVSLASMVPYYEWLHPGLQSTIEECLKVSRDFLLKT